MSKVFDAGAIARSGYKLKDLNGKTLSLRYEEDLGYGVLAGHDKETGVIYVLATGEVATPTTLTTYYRPKYYRNTGCKNFWKTVGDRFDWEKSKEVFTSMNTLEFFGWETMEAP